MSGSVFSTLSGVLTGKHPTTGLLCRETGEVLVPASGVKKEHWTYGSDNGRGYMTVTFRGKHYKVHRLICQTFHDNPLNLPTVDHYPDRNPSNNHASNLRFASYKTQADNTRSVDASIAKYGVRTCTDRNAYYHARRDKEPEFVERCRADGRAYQARKRALGKHYRTCPDGIRRWLTNEEYDKLYGTN